MDIRDFISGTPEQKDDFSALVMSQSIMFATDLILLIDRWIDDLPDEMKAELAHIINHFYGMVSEFVDVQALMEYAPEEGDE